MKDGKIDPDSKIGQIQQTTDGKTISKQYICEYCGHDCRDPRVERKIWRNGKSVMLKFCCQERGGMYQMGCEG